MALVRPFFFPVETLHVPNHSEGILEGFVGGNRCVSRKSLSIASFSLLRPFRTLPVYQREAYAQSGCSEVLADSPHDGVARGVWTYDGNDGNRRMSTRSSITRRRREHRRWRLSSLRFRRCPRSFSETSTCVSRAVYVLCSVFPLGRCGLGVHQPRGVPRRARHIFVFSPCLSLMTLLLHQGPAARGSPRGRDSRGPERREGGR